MERIGKRVQIPRDPVAVIGESAANTPLAIKPGRQLQAQIRKPEDLPQS